MGAEFEFVAEQWRQPSLDPSLADLDNSPPLCWSLFLKNLSFARREMKNKILSHFFNARPTVPQHVVSPTPSPTPAPISTSTNRGSSISQYLRAAKEILQDVVSDTEYV